MEFYYPTITNKKDCRGCQDCVNSCPVHALEYNEDLHVDKKKCRKYQEKIQDICMNCVQYCRKKVIQLEEGI